MYIILFKYIFLKKFKKEGEMKEKLMPVILVIIILAALGFIVKQAIPKKPSYTAILVDVKAKKIFKQEMIAGQQITYPVKSPYSGEKTAYLVYKCTKCGTIFAYVPYIPKSPEEEAAMNPELMMPKCPKCGSIEVIVPEIPEGKKELDVNQAEIPVVDASKGIKK